MKTRKYKNNSNSNNKSIKKRVTKVLDKLKKSKKVDIKQNLNLFLNATNQYKSGRCWLFSLLNLFRISTIYHHKLNPDFNFSPNYLMFWDKYEKANYFLILCSKYSSLDLNDINNYLLFNNILNDGGTWNMIQNLVGKYGVVPYELMKETENTINTDNLNNLLINKLKVFAKEIRSNNKSRHSSIIKKNMNMIFKLLCNLLGNPPKKVTSFANKKINCTPLEFYNKYIKNIKGNNVQRKIQLLNVPHLNYNEFYTIKEVNNMDNNNDVLYFNINKTNFKKFILNSLNDNVPVWFGSDFDKFHFKEESLLNNEIYSNSNSNKKLYLNKENAIQFYQTNVNHAMLLTGYHYNRTKNNPSYWIVENSHDNKLKRVSFENNNGNVTLSKSWFEKYTINAAVDEKYITDKTIYNIIKQKSNINELPKWSNLGELLVI